VEDKENRKTRTEEQGGSKENKKKDQRNEVNKKKTKRVVGFIPVLSIKTDSFV
jgi:hypothetical protein